ncbi:uncharacterized protein LOC120196359 [Hibiscus syriacus]|uniref:uncharacterized protein LOC120196359 n=1 Tax=Hibiscus syriacus TaxID=106335 RepID=UPI0019242331|nr:uncharacterized protein LOC120196359 [Hibiscus syriacus]
MLKPREIINGILPDYGFKARYAHVWRGLESDKEKPQVPYDEGYNQLPSLLIRQIVENNLLFGALQASLHGFKNGCRPLLFLDTVTIKSKYQSKLLTVTALDGNEGIFPVAFAVADVVNDDNVETDENQRDFSYLCTEEVLQVIITHFYDAARATTLDDSENLSRTSKIFHQRLVSGSCTSLLQSGPEHWSNVLFQGYRYGHFSSNVADAFYSWITELSVIPIANKMIDTICCKMMELMSIQKSDSSQWLTKLTPAVEFKLEHHILKANMLQCQCHIVALSKSDSFGAIYVLNNDLWDCSCRECNYEGVFARTSEYFTVHAFWSSYSNSINPVATADMAVQNKSSTIEQVPRNRTQSTNMPSILIVAPKSRRICKIAVDKARSDYVI